MAAPLLSERCISVCTLKMLHPSGACDAVPCRRTRSALLMLRVHAQPLSQVVMGLVRTTPPLSHCLSTHLLAVMRIGSITNWQGVFWIAA